MTSDCRSGMTPRLLQWLAWRRYLTSVRAAPPAAYEVVEEHAWERLVDDLARVGLEHPAASRDGAPTVAGPTR